MRNINLRNYKTVTERREGLAKELDVALKNIGSFTLDDATASTRNCENMIGAAQIPMGIAGPLRLVSARSGQAISKREYYVPLATTEGALVASINRGCKAVGESGGAFVAAETVGATRGPVFQTSGIAESLKLKNWLDEHFQELSMIAKQTSSHLALIKLGTRLVGKLVYVRFYFDTQDAMGMNMVTIASTSMYRYIEVETRVKCLTVAANFDVDKKPAWLNFILGRGKQVWAEATVPAGVLKETLKTSAKNIYDVWLNKCMIGSAMAGSMGYNAHYANVIAALFLATGQDIAHVSEGSVGITTAEVDGDSLYLSIYLPDLMIGTVGGGTGLATQKEAFSILGITGSQKTEDFAKIIAGAVLAGELSLLASLSEGSLARAHQDLARGKKMKQINIQKRKQ